MAVKVRDKGNYELFVTDEGHRILALNNERWFAWVEGNQGEILVRSDSDHKKDRTLQEGRFYVADFEDDPKFRDVPHLFLQKGDRYQEVIIPNGLPTDQDQQKKVIRTDETLSEEDLEAHLGCK